MTKQEVCEKYNIPAELIDKYEKYRKCTSYDDTDLENISMIMTLYDAGFDDSEAEKYIKLYLSGKNTCAQRTALLTQKRKNTLDAIHKKQTPLDGIDYLRYKISKNNTE